MLEKKRNFIILLLFLILGFSIYSNSFTVPFHYDDRVLISENEKLHNLKLFLEKEFFTSNRPILLLTFALNYRLGSESPFGYHLVNLIFHILTAFLIYLILDEIFLRMHLDNGLFPALLSSLIFLTHPLATEAVTYISSRSSVMSGFFYLLSLYFFIKTCNKKKNYFIYSAGSLISFLLSVGCKEIGITLPAVFLLFDYYFISGEDGERISANFKRFHLPLIATGIFIVFLKFKFALSLSSPDMAQRDFLAHIYSSSFAVIFYLKKFLLPMNLNIDPDFPLIDSILKWRFVISFLLMLGLLVISKKIGPKAKLISFSILWFFLTLFPHLFIRLKDVMAERWLYLTLAGFGFFAAGLLANSRSRVFSAKHEEGIYMPVAVVMVFVILFFSIETYSRNDIWGSSISLWSDAAKKSPNKFRPYNNLGEAYAAEGEDDRAIEEYKKAIELNPKAERVLYNLGNVYSRKGEVSAAIDAYTRTVEINPSYAKAYNNLGSLYLNNGDYEKAKEEFLKAIKIEPRFPQAYNNLGNAYSKSGMPSKAILEYIKAIRIDPKYATAHYNLAREFYTIRYYQGALKELELAAKLSPKPEYLERLEEVKRKIMQ